MQRYSSLRKVPFPRIPIAVDEKDVGRFFVANVLNDIFEDSFDVQDDDHPSRMLTVLARREAKRHLDAVRTSFVQAVPRKKADQEKSRSAKTRNGAHRPEGKSCRIHAAQRALTSYFAQSFNSTSCVR